MTTYTEEFCEREFIGYGLEQPDPKWPGGAKVAVSFVVQYNMGAESNVGEGDAWPCNDYLELPIRRMAPIRVEASENMYEFGGREGIARVMALFKKYNLPVTWNIYTRALEKSPYWVKPLLEAGGEISLGGHHYRNNMDVEPEEEDRMIDVAIDKLQQLTGDKTLPHGWFSDRRSNLTVQLYSAAHAKRGLPLSYSSDSCSDDLPYWRPAPGGREGGLLMVPFSYDCSDIRFNAKGSGWASPKDYVAHLKDTFDCLWEEGEEGEAKMMTVLLHPHIIGRASRTKWFEEFLQYITSKPEGSVWVATRESIANHWKATFPYDPKTAFGQTKVPECGSISFP